MTAQLKISTRCVSLLAIIAAGLVAAILSLTAFTSTAHARSVAGLAEIYKGEYSHILIPDYPTSFEYHEIEGKPIKNCKSSNKNVATAKATKSWGGSGYMMTIKIKKPGTAKISYTYKGKKHTVTFKVQKYVNPFKLFKVGSKDYSSCFNAKNFGDRGSGRLLEGRTTSDTDISGRIDEVFCNSHIKAVDIVGASPKISAKTGWKIDKINYRYWSHSKQRYVTIKNKGKIPKGVNDICAEMKNKKTGFVEKCIISFSGDGRRGW